MRNPDPENISALKKKRQKRVCLWWLVARSHLSLLVQKHFVDAGVEGGAREHGGDGVGQVQHGLEHRVHGLRCKDIQGNQFDR